MLRQSEYNSEGDDKKNVTTLVQGKLKLVLILILILIVIFVFWFDKYANYKNHNIVVKENEGINDEQEEEANTPSISKRVYNHLQSKNIPQHLPYSTDFDKLANKYNAVNNMQKLPTYFPIIPFFSPIKDSQVYEYNHSFKWVNSLNKKTRESLLHSSNVNIPIYKFDPKKKIVTLDSYKLISPREFDKYSFNYSTGEFKLIDQYQIDSITFNGSEMVINLMSMGSYDIILHIQLPNGYHLTATSIEPINYCKNSNLTHFPDLITWDNITVNKLIDYEKILLDDKENYPSKGELSNLRTTSFYHCLEDGTAQKEHCADQDTWYAGGGKCKTPNLLTLTCWNNPTNFKWSPINNSNFYYECTNPGSYIAINCPPNAYFDGVKCVSVNQCQNQDNGKRLIVTDETNPLYNKGYIQCLDGQEKTYDCTQAFVGAQLAPNKISCTESECWGIPDNQPFVKYTNLTPENSDDGVNIVKFPIEYVKCQQGVLRASLRIDPMLSKFTETINKTRIKQIQQTTTDQMKFSQLKYNEEWKVQYYMPNKILHLNNTTNKYEICNLTSFRDAPDGLFTKGKLRAINSKCTDILQFAKY
jgi:hypothetical protein